MIWQALPGRLLGGSTVATIVLVAHITRGSNPYGNYVMQVRRTTDLVSARIG